MQIKEAYKIFTITFVHSIVYILIFVIYEDIYNIYIHDIYKCIMLLQQYCKKKWHLSIYLEYSQI